jgi:ubiquinone/menaquinone biosynthesis C-methylase UbiE
VTDVQLSTRYDAVNAALFLPTGGSGRLRQELVDALDVGPGQRVLELGCGTGLVTARLLAAGATVVALDGLPGMLEGARRRAPDATYVVGDAIDTDVGGDYDRVVLSFVLHNFDAEGRVRLLRRAATALAPDAADGRVGVLEWARPPGARTGRWWRRFLAALEPSPTVPEILDGALEAEVPAAGLRVLRRRRVAGRRAQVLVLAPTATGRAAGVA